MSQAARDESEALLAGQRLAYDRHGFLYSQKSLKIKRTIFEQKLAAQAAFTP
jgi:hypothetical protein